MKKLLLSVLLASLLLVPTATFALADDLNAAPVTVTENEAYTPGEAPAQDCAAAMSPAIHAVLLAMQNQDRTVFTTEDPVLTWEMLYNLLSMYGQLDDRSDYDGELLVLPSETVWDYSAALFAAPLDPADLPEELADRMTYDAESDCYYLCCGSDGLSEVTLTTVPAADGSLLVSGSLVFTPEELELASFTAVLTAADNLFGYTLAQLNVL